MALKPRLVLKTNTAVEGTSVASGVAFEVKAVVLFIVVSVAVVSAVVAIVPVVISVEVVSAVVAIVPVVPIKFCKVSLIAVRAKSFAAI